MTPCSPAKRVCSNSAGKNPDNFFYNIRNDPSYGFHEYHATTMENPLLPNAPRKRVLRLGLSASPNSARTWSRTTIRLSIPRNTWRNSSIGRAPPSSVETSSSLTANLFPAREVRRGLRHYRHCLKDRNRERRDGRHFLRVRFRRSHPASRPLILDWDIAQIEGAVLETWLPNVFARLEELARLCGARHGSIGAFIEDKNSGTILLQQALRRQMPARD
jgi:hypothetical protein